MPYSAIASRLTCLVFVFAAAVIASAESPAPPQATPPPAQWLDPSTGLMWAGKDNGKAVPWLEAAKYCRNLRLGGYSDWGLATIDELQGISDAAASAPGLGAGTNGKNPTTWHVKGNLFLTGMEWSSTRSADVEGGSSGSFWYFNFWSKVRASAEGHFENGSALCVRPRPSFADFVTAAESAAADRRLREATQAPESWVDPSTGLMWAGRDNGKDVKWHTAMEYCQNLRLAGYADWRLGTIDELGGIYDSTARSPGLREYKYRDQPATWHVKGNLFLTGIEWSSTQEIDYTGRPNAFAWTYGFWDRPFKSYTDGSRFGSFHRALCVRGAQPAVAVSDPTKAPVYWADPSTGLMWAGRDNGEDVNWKAATSYCHELRLAGYSDWRLPTIDELDGIYDGSARAPGGAGQHGEKPFTWHVKGNLFLTGEEWSSTQRRVWDRPGVRVWYAIYDIGHYKFSKSENASARALCVTQSGQL